MLSHHGTNELAHNHNFSTTENPEVARGNVDTLYWFAIIDLPSTDVVLEVPEITDRYWVYPLYDA